VSFYFLLKTFSIEEEMLEKSEFNFTLFNGFIFEYDLDDEDTFSKIKSIAEYVKRDRKMFEADLNIL
jgi:hypothetical protein